MAHPFDKTTRASGRIAAVMPIPVNNNKTEIRRAWPDSTFASAIG